MWNKLPKIGLAFVAVYFIWGSNYAVLKLAVVQASPLLIAGTRCLVAGPILLFAGLLIGESLPSRIKDYIVIALAGILVLLVASVTVTWAQQWVPSSVSAVIMASSAIWLSVFGIVGRSSERPSFSHWLSPLLGIAGLVAVLISGGGSRDLATPVLPALAILGAAVSMALGTLLMRRCPISCHPLIAAGLQSCLAGILLMLIALASGGGLRWNWSASLALELAYLALFGSGIAYVLYCWLALQVSPNRLGSVVYVSPAVAVLIGFLLMGESLTLIQWGGILTILLATILLIRR